MVRTSSLAAQGPQVSRVLGVAPAGLWQWRRTAVAVAAGLQCLDLLKPAGSTLSRHVNDAYSQLVSTGTAQVFLVLLSAAQPMLPLFA